MSSVVQHSAFRAVYISRDEMQNLTLGLEALHAS